MGARSANGRPEDRAPDLSAAGGFSNQPETDGFKTRLHRQAGGLSSTGGAYRALFNTATSRNSVISVVDGVMLKRRAPPFQVSGTELTS